MTCFKPNLTSELMVRGVEKIADVACDVESLLEVGCGAGYITNRVLELRLFQNLKKVRCSDIQLAAIEEISPVMARWSPQFDVCEARAGSGISCWSESEIHETDLIINDISAVNEEVASLFGYFSESVCGAGPSGLENLTDFLVELDELSFSGILVLPLLSLARRELFFELIRQHCWSTKCVLSKRWPLETDVATANAERLTELKEAGDIEIEILGGLFVAKTEIYVLERDDKSG